MTDQLIMTTAERDLTLEALRIQWNAAPADAEPKINEARNMLQSLPMVTGEPVAYLAHFYIEPTIHTEAEDGFDVVEPIAEGAFPVYTSPQALAPITVDDVTDEMVDEYHKDIAFSQYAKLIITAAYNAVIKHRL